MREAAALRRALTAWYRRAKRDLPWRGTSDPYRIWVSEVMLQQTQVATVRPYYHRFLAAFPDVRALAAAPRDRVLAAWAGLGYYRRARFLHEGAALVVREHAGRVPDDPQAFAALPGVGRYTLGAVMSIGFGRSLPVLDGNVARVLSRLFALPLAVKRPADARRLWGLAEELMPPARGRIAPGEWNQALMELGATVCTPRAPRCHACPVRRHCRAFASRRTAVFPPVAERRASVAVRRAVAIVERAGQWLLVRRTGTLLEGLWEPPGVDLERSEDAGDVLEGELLRLGLRARLEDTGERVRHAITHRRITVEVWRAWPVGALPRANRARRWAVPGQRDLALGALARRVEGLLPPVRRRVGATPRRGIKTASR